MYNKNGKIGLFKADNGGLFHLFRITFLFLLATIGFIRPVSAQTAEAAKTITLNVQNRPIKEVLTLIERQSDYIFVYYDNILDIHRKVTLKVTNQPISAVLKQLFAGTDNTWKLSGRQIVIGRSVAAAAATPRKITRITGVVRDQNNDPLIGVTIRIKARPNIGTATDINGKYLLDVYPDEVLEFSYVGYKSQDVSVAGQEIVDVVMLQNDAILDAVEVVGYGVQKKISVIGSQQTIATKELKVPVANLTQGLAGRVSGLVSVQRTSEPGFDDANIYIRGISTLTASMSAPLTLVDGVPRSFSNVDPEDIESFSILKDASATAVYGVRGANGVIIINTKSGLKGRPKFSVRYTEGLTKPTKITDFADGATYMEMSNEASLTRGGGKLYSQEIIDKTRRGEDPYLYPDVDWMKQILRNFSRNRSANVNVQGGSDKAVYYIGLAYYDENGMYKDTKLADYNSNAFYRRYNVTSNLTLNPFRTTEIKLGIQGYLANANYPASSQASIFESAYFTPPTYIAPLYPDGKLGAFSGGDINPVAQLGATGYANQWRSQVYSNLRITQQIYKGLSVSGMFSFDTYNYTSNRFTKTPNTYHATGRDANGNLLYEQTRQGTENLAYSLSAKGNRAIYLEAAVNYRNTFGRHTVSGMMLFNQSDEINTKATNVEEALPYRFRGLAGRFTYSFDDRYFGEFNFGYNGSENFKSGERFGVFPAGAIGYLISNEPFWKVKWINHLKIRGSIGLVGSDVLAAGRFAYLSTWESGLGGHYFGPNATWSAGIGEAQEGVLGLTWEKGLKKDLGLELKMFDSMVSIDLDYFHEKRWDILIQRSSVPGIAGLNQQPLANMGRMTNHGFEATAEFNHHIGKVNYRIYGNFSFARNKITEKDEAPTDPWRMRTGHPLNQQFGLIALGLFEDQDEIDLSPEQKFGTVRPGDVKYLDYNGDGVVDAHDEVAIGYSRVPEINYGFGLQINWKGLDFGAFFRGQAHVSYSLGGSFFPFANGVGKGNLFAKAMDRWSEENPNPNAFYPRLSASASANNQKASTRTIYDGSLLRLSDLEVGYTFRGKHLKSWGCQSLRVYFVGSNLLLFSPWDMWDPESGSTNGSNYPLARKFNLGVRISF